ncbi:MAG: glycerol-3-phosphate dehydrogenase/oxidase [Candidatus Lokiarchaeota archaeon]|nr:glycerol-3-phosphate dehydrogenase/oxidase [Candidatus Lokiarchaeota archaeon]
MDDLETKLFDQSWTLKNREKIISNMQEIQYDVVIIGAGITGAGVAREAAMRGLKVAIVEMQDFAAGTSSRSTKMAHGGIRYVANNELDLVKKATRERNWMRAHIPHLVRPIPFLLVVIEGGKYKKRDFQSITKIYDFLSDDKSDFKNYERSKYYSAEELYELEPEFSRKGLKGGVIYYDTNIDDARLTIEILKEAIVRGTDAINYCKVIGYTKNNGKITGIKCKDLNNESNLEIKGKLLINATGIWTDDLVEKYPENIPEPLIRPTKGVHLLYKRADIKNLMANGLYSEVDNRFFFVIPRDKKYTLVGTTDTDFQGDLAKPFCNKEDADYLIRSVQKYYPNADLGYDKILSTYAGIRPLVMQKGKPESEVSRQHVIFFSDDNLLTITGGKLTEWREMAEDLFEYIEEKEIFPGIKRNKYWSRKPFIISLEKDEWSNVLKKSHLSLNEDITDHIYQQYGKGAIKILDMIEKDESLSKRVIDENDFIKAEILYVLRYEFTPHLIDVFCRRTEMSLLIHHRRASEAAEKVATIMQKEYSWDDETKNNEIQIYLNYVKKSVSFILE